MPRRNRHHDSIHLPVGQVRAHVAVGKRRIRLDDGAVVATMNDGKRNCRLNSPPHADLNLGPGRPMPSASAASTMDGCNEFTAERWHLSMSMPDDRFGHHRAPRQQVQRRQHAVRAAQPLEPPRSCRLPVTALG